MSIYDFLLNHFRKPKGIFGGMVASKMNESHKNLSDWGFGFIDVPHDAIALDIGCGGGATVRRLAKLAPDGHIYGADYSKKAVKMTRKFNRDLVRSGSVTIEQADVSDLPYEDDTFDVITAIETYFFWPDPETDFVEVRRTLKPGGEFMVLSATYKNEKFHERNMRWVPKLNMHYHTPDQFRQLFVNAGFNEVGIQEQIEKGYIAGIAKK
jgi:ubiquinone/menaquinone biosynthesis C-methylase UbiE